MQYFVHNGFSGWAYGTPSDPQLISPKDALELFRRASLTIEQVRRVDPPAQFADAETPLFKLLGGNRFLCFADIENCTDKRTQKTSRPLVIDWSVL